jgi:hypothetical protein
LLNGDSRISPSAFFPSWASKDKACEDTLKGKKWHKIHLYLHAKLVWTVSSITFHTARISTENLQVKFPHSLASDHQESLVYPPLTTFLEVSAGYYFRYCPTLWMNSMPE